MKHYTHLIFDADHTLLDYIEDELAAFRSVYTELGMPITDEVTSFSRHTSEMEWTKAGLYDVHDPLIQRDYHKLYRSHVTGIFEAVFAKFSFAADPQKAGERFLDALCAPAHTYAGVEELLRCLSKKSGGRYEITIATNGLSSIQNGRLSALKPFVAQIFISEEVGSIKPLRGFFSALLQKTHARKEECLMIGDSLSSDVAGAQAIGIDACWYNPKGMENISDHKPTFEINRLDQLWACLEKDE